MRERSEGPRTTGFHADLRRRLVVGTSTVGLAIALFTGTGMAAPQPAPAAVSTPVQGTTARLSVPASGQVTCDRGSGTCAGARRASGDPDGGAATKAQALPSGYPFRELQMNLCNSGYAGCYENGQSVPEAAGVITSKAPDLVTLNEICKADVSGSLLNAMTAAWPAGDWVFWTFRAAGDRSTGGAYHCKNGDEYGNGILGHVPAADWSGVDVYGGVYPDSTAGSPTQDTSSKEERSWACTYAIGDYYGCTTHLTSSNSTVAFNQCVSLMSSIVPGIRAQAGAHPSVVAGDLNLKYGGSPNVQNCVPSGWYRKGDGDVQHVTATNDLAFQSGQSIGMSHTDHDAWLVSFKTP